MTREEAIFCEGTYLGENNCINCKYYATDTCESRESHKMAIEALKAEPCEAVSREAVMQTLTELGYGDEENGADAEYMSALYDVAEKVKALPPVTPKQRTGKWIWDNFFEEYACSCCYSGSDTETHFCPKCGAEMEGVRE